MVMQNDEKWRSLEKKIVLDLLTDADLFVLIVDVTGWASADVLLLVIDVVVTMLTRGGIGAERLAVVPSQIIDAHFHAVNAWVELFSAFVHICDTPTPGQVETATPNIDTHHPPQKIGTQKIQDNINKNS